MELDIPRDPLIGQVLEGRYRVQGRIGGGGMGSVYRAVQAGGLERDVAIKVINVGHDHQGEIVQRFESEARIISALRHPNTLKLFDSGRLRDGRLFLVTELLQGAALSEMLLAGALSVPRTLKIILQICDSLAEAHALGVVHRDIKPSNIYVEDVAGQDIVKVLDFGIAKVDYYPSLTNPGNVMGTPGFMSPEQCCGERLDPRSDIYSLGAIFYQCLCGQPPFVGASGNPVDLVLRHIQDPLVPLRRRPGLEGLNPDIDALVCRMLAKSRDDRPARIGLVAERIAETLSLMAVPPTQVAARPLEAPARAIPQVRKLSIPGEAESDGLDPEQQSTVVARSNVDEPAPPGQREALLAARDEAEAERIEVSQETLDIGEPTAPEIESRVILVDPADEGAPEEPAVEEPGDLFHEETEGTVRTHSDRVAGSQLEIDWKPLLFWSVAFVLLGMLGAAAWFLASSG